MYVYTHTDWPGYIQAPPRFSSLALFSYELSADGTYLLLV